MIIFESVTKKYPPQVTAVLGINLHILPGEFVSIVGQSGTGKTTLIKLLTAEEQATEGKITVGGWDITRLSQRDRPFLRRQIGVIFQDFKLLSKKTVFENVSFALEVAGKPDSMIKKHVLQLLRIVGLEDKGLRYPKHLSGGEQQRVAIARALAHHPKRIERWKTRTRVRRGLKSLTLKRQRKKQGPIVTYNATRSGRGFFQTLYYALQAQCKHEPVHARTRITANQNAIQGLEQFLWRNSTGLCSSVNSQLNVIR